MAPPPLGLWVLPRVNGSICEASNGIDRHREAVAPHQLPFDSEVAEGNSGTMSFEAARKLARPLLGRAKTLGLEVPFEAYAGWLI